MERRFGAEYFAASKKKSVDGFEERRTRRQLKFVNHKMLHKGV